MIRKTRNKQEWKVISRTTGKVLGTYRSKFKARERLDQIEMFKHMEKRRKKK